ncbi:MAG: hypothetical protein ACKOXK_01655 [Chakrabartia sp.]
MSDQNSAEVPSPLAGLGIVAVVAIAIIGWAIIGGRLFQETSLFGGFLMLWHYANMEQLEIKKLPQALAGAVIGIALSWQVVWLTQQMGPHGTLIGLLVMLAGIYLQVIAVLPMFFNASAMLYLTVAAAPLVQLKVDFVDFALATVAGGLFFAGFVESVKWLAAKLSK